MEIKKLTLDEYFAKMKEYFTSTGNEDKVLKFISTTGYQCWLKCKTIKELAHMYWVYEPLMQRYYDNEQQVLDQMEDSFQSGIAGAIIRWLPGMEEKNLVCIQPIVFGNKELEYELESYYNASLTDKLFGRLMDPYVYTGPIIADEEDYIIEDAPEHDDLNNYATFYTELTVDEYNKQEQEFINSLKTKKFDDGLCTYSNGDYEFTDELKQLFKENTQFDVG